MRRLGKFLLSVSIVFATIVALIGGVAENSFAQIQKRVAAKAEWLDSNREAPNGTTYKSFNSKTLKGEVSYLIYLPPGYDQETTRYPVIYWLHGLGGNQRGGTFSFVPHVDAAIKAKALVPCIVVVVNGMVNSFYCDWDNDKLPMESVVIKDLVPHIDATYRTVARREGRLIEGYSMGGFGAAHLGFKYPDVFGTVVIDAGALIGEIALKGPNLSSIFEQIFANDKGRFQAEHPTQLVTKNADQLRGKTNIRIGCGEKDTLLARNRELHELLDTLKIEHQYEIVPDVAHNSSEYYRALGDKNFSLHQKVFEGLAKEK